MLSIIRTNSENPDFISLVSQLDKELTVMDGEKHDYYNQFNKIEGIPYVLVAYVAKKAIACGALKPYNETTLEVKRMFTQLSARGQGLGKTIVEALELWAKELGYQQIILETGISFTAANTLYKKQGYLQIPNYDQYVGVSDSICFKKQLV